MNNCRPSFSFEPTVESRAATIRWKKAKYTYTLKSSVGTTQTVSPTMFHSYNWDRNKTWIKFQKSCLKAMGRAYRQSVLWQTERWPDPVWWICDTAAQGPRAWLLGCGLAIMVCLITCIATQQVISQAETEGLTCHREINNPSTRSGYLKKRGGPKCAW